VSGCCGSIDRTVRVGAEAAAPVRLAGHAGTIVVGRAAREAMPARHAAPVGRAASLRGRDARAEAVAHPDDRVVAVARAPVPVHATGIPRLRAATGTGAVAVSVGVARRRGIDGAVEGADRPLSSRNENAGTGLVAPRAGAVASGAAADTVRADPGGSADATLALGRMIARLTQRTRLRLIRSPVHHPIGGRARVRRYRSGIAGTERARPAAARARRDQRQRHHAAHPYRHVRHQQHHDARAWAPCQPAARFPSTSHSSGRLRRVSNA